MFDSSLIKTQNNLLAFSAGVDSSALFFILLDKNINFDIAIVDYNLREQSKDEVKYAKELAKKYNKKIYLKEYSQDKFSEKKARDFRYDFFDEIIKNNNYDSLITAHQLNDKLEWFLMQLTKGAGLVELIGLEEKSKRKDYIIYKPLLDISKNTLLEYLDTNKIKYFIDKSNNENIYKRNYFRNEFSNKLLDKYENGIKNSFTYMQEDKKSLNNVKEEYIFDKLIYTKFYNNDFNLILRYVDVKLKELGILISKATRDEIKEKKEIVVSHKYALSINEDCVFIAPYIKNSMSKKDKELFRIHKIPSNIRGYLSSKSAKFKNIVLNVTKI